MNRLDLNLNEANTVRQGLELWGQMTNPLSRGQMINSFAQQLHKGDRPFLTWKTAEYN